MNARIRKVILCSHRGYDAKHDELLQQLIAEKVLLFCVIGQDCELWHDVMDELYVNSGAEKDFLMITTFHPHESLNEVIEFTKDFEFDGIDNSLFKVIEV